MPGKRYVRPESTDDVDAEVRPLDLDEVLRVECLRDGPAPQADETGEAIRETAERALSRNGVVV